MSEHPTNPPVVDMIEEKEGYVRDYLTGDLIEATAEEIEARQIFLRKLVEEYGYSKNQIGTEYLIKKGSKTIGPADIAVFHNSTYSIDNIHIIVETKRSNRTDGLDQLKSYLSPTPAEFGVWFNGDDLECIRNSEEPPYFREIPDIPRAGETLEDVGLYRKKDLQPASELKSTFETIHNHIYANEGYLKEKVFEEMLKVIFIKMVDEKSGGQTCKFRITDEEMEKVQEGRDTDFTDRIHQMFSRVMIEYRDVFDENEKLNLSPNSLAYAVSKLQKYSLTNTPSDIKGTAFQTFIGPMQRGERGEFFTPQPVVDLCVSMLSPSDGEVVLDPACGSGGFLVSAMKFVESQFEDNRTDVSESDLRDMVIRYAKNYIRGIDFNPDLARVAKMYMVLYDDGHTGIFSENSLEDFDKIERSAKDAGANSNMGPGSIDVILTNPPFGSKGKVENKRILRQFDLGFKWRKANNGYEKTGELRNGQSPETLFLERCLQFLKDGGRMAIVVPDGILTNSTTQYVREYIKLKARILAIISLPNGTFRQAGVNPNASILFLRKHNEDDLRTLKSQEYKIFMAQAEEIGYELDKKTAETKFVRDNKGNIVHDEDGEPKVKTDIPEIVDEFEVFKYQQGLNF